MDVNFKNCPKCGHAVSNAVAACTYCGTVLSNEEPIPPPADEASEVRPPSTEATLSSTEKDPPFPSTAETVAAEFPGPKDLFHSEQTTVVNLSPEIAELVEEDSALAGEGAPEFDLPAEVQAAATHPATPPETEMLDLTGSTHGAPALELKEYIKLAALESHPEIAMIPEPGKSPGNELVEMKEEAILLAPENEVRPAGTDSPVEIGDIKKKAEAIEQQRKAILAKAVAFKQKKLLKQKAEALQRKKTALARTAALQKQREVQAKIEAGRCEEAAAVVHHNPPGHPMIVQGVESNSKMLGLLKKYEGRAIGINYDNSAVIKEAELVAANDELFSVFVKDKALHYSYPLNTILTVIEGADGVESSESEPKEKFNAVIKVYPLVLF
jgi:hypothetical protein